jgi:hypothetical protein
MSLCLSAVMFFANASLIYTIISILIGNVISLFGCIIFNTSIWSFWYNKQKDASLRRRIESENKKLDNAIIFLAENNKNKNNIAEYSDAIKVIREHVNTNTKNNVFENTDIDSFAKKMIDEFNTKYSTLSKEEMEIIKKINISENKEIIFNQYKKECLDKLSEYSNKCSDEENQKITEVFNKVKNKSFVAENIGSDICGFIELTKLFD